MLFNIGVILYPHLFLSIFKLIVNAGYIVNPIFVSFDF